MQEIRIKLDYSHGPIWKEKFDAATGEWSTCIDIIDNDAALQLLNSEAERIYTSLYVIDEDNKCIFQSDLFEMFLPRFPMVDLFNSRRKYIG